MNRSTGGYRLHLAARVACCALLALTATGCAIRPILVPANDRPFDFHGDTFAYANELEWDYRTDFRTGTTTTSSRDVEPSYSRHCIVMARTARQFFQFARFEPKAPLADDETYRALVHGVISRSPSETLPERERIVIPGFANLRQFSTVKERLLKAEIGGWAGSYFQLGNWRMVFPFSRGHQEDTAHAMLGEVRTHRPPIVHLVRFPRITINHGVVVYGAKESAGEIRFDVYDPNEPEEPTVLVYDKGSRSFSFPPNRYFGGGPLDVYEIFRDGIY
jgi:hypothetical protein